MTARVGYVLSALVLGLGALVGIQYSSATFTDDTHTPTRVTSARDWTPPTVSVNNPGAVINGVVSIVATASDADTSVASVEIQYRLQGTPSWQSLCVDDHGSPWDCTWDTDTVDDGIYELRAIATDEDGNTETSATIITKVFNSSGVVLNPVPSPIRGTVRLTAHMINVANGSSWITFQSAPAGDSRWTDMPGCTYLRGPDASCDFATTGRPDGRYDLRAVGTRGPKTYEDVQTGVEIDNTAPTVTVNQAATQADPSGAQPVEFTVVFSEPVTGFDDSDVTVGGTVAGARTVTVTGSGTTYTVTISGFTGSGTVTASIGSGRASDPAGNSNLASTSTDNVVTVDATLPTVTVEQAAAQLDPTKGGTINFTVLFSKNVTGFNSAGVVLSGTAGTVMSATVTGSGKTYNVAVTGMSQSGTVVASVPAGRAVDSVGNGNVESTSVDNSVLYDITPPTVTIDQATTQKDPTNGSTINFTAVFNEPVTGFTNSGVTMTGTMTGTRTVTVTGSGTTYNIAVTGLAANGTVIASIAGGKAFDLAGNGNTASTSTDNVVTRDTVAPTATLVRGPDQITPTTTSPISYIVTFSEDVTGFDASDLTVTGASGGTKVVTVTGSGTTYNVDITGMTSDGTVIVSSVPAGAATDLAGNNNTVSTATSTVRTITWSDGVAPSVTINQAVGQADPASTSPITFTVVFSEPVTGFINTDVTLSGTAAGTKTIVVSGSGPTYTVTVSGMTTGTVTAAIAAGKASDLGGRTNTASTSTDNTVTYDACVNGSATLTATADAWTDQAATAQNKGTDSTLSVESKTSASKRAFVKFALPFPSGCAVTVATLRLYNASPTSGRTIDVFRAATDWSEEVVTWGNQPVSAGTGVGVTTVTTAGYQQWNVLTHVQTQSAGSNFGFLIKDRTETAAGLKQGYQSREAASNLPQLVVTWN